MNYWGGRGICWRYLPCDILSTKGWKASKFRQNDLIISEPAHTMSVGQRPRRTRNSVFASRPRRRKITLYQTGHAECARREVICRLFGDIYLTNPGPSSGFDVVTMVHCAKSPSQHGKRRYGD